MAIVALALAAATLLLMLTTLSAIARQNAQLEELMEMLTELEVAVRRNSDVTKSAIEFIRGVAEKLQACKTDPVKIQALRDELVGNADSLAAAIVTTDEPTPDPVPAPEPTPEPDPVVEAEVVASAKRNRRYDNVG